MRRFAILFILSTAFLITSAAKAQEASGNPSLTDLAQSRMWRALIGYHGGHGASKSDVITPDYFLSPEGEHDPLTELVATREAMLAPTGDDPDAHAQCRHPARFLWLMERGALPADTPRMACAKYREWIGARKPTGASIIFASGHLTNPATFYGHMLLRITADTPEGGNPADELLETTLNYGAVFPPNENGFFYVTKGLTGQYRSTFSNMEFYRHLHQYTEVQMRDIWQYKLNLTPAQTELLVAQAWELQGAYNHYYFLKQNCAYKIAVLVSTVLDEPIVPDNKPWIMPVDVLDKVATARNGDMPLLKSAERLDSRQTRLRDKYLSLSPPEKARVSRFLNQPSAGIAPRLAGLDDPGKARVVETLLDYYTVPVSEKKPPLPENEAIRRQLMVTRLDLPPGRADFGQPISPVKPHKGQKSSLFEVSAVNTSKLGSSGAEIRLRAAYNDFLSLTPGALPYSELTFGDLRLEVANQKLFIRSLEAIRITTLNVSQTGLPKDGGKAWRVSLGAEQESLGCRTCLTGYVEGGIGKGVWLSKTLVGYAMLNARLTGPDARDGALHTGLTTGLVYNTSKGWRAQAQLGAWQDLDGDGKLKSVAKLEARHGLGKDRDFSAGLQFEEEGGKSTTRFNTGLSFYW